MIASVSTLICLIGAATPSSTVNLSMVRNLLGISCGQRHTALWLRVKSLKDWHFLYSYQIHLEPESRLAHVLVGEPASTSLGHALARRPLDRFHVVIRRAEVMPDLVH